jgi:hypothetical protein
MGPAQRIDNHLTHLITGRTLIPLNQVLAALIDIETSGTCHADSVERGRSNINAATIAGELVSSAVVLDLLLDLRQEVSLLNAAV